MGRRQNFFKNLFDSATKNDFEYTRGNVDFTVAISATRNTSSSDTFTPFTNHNGQQLFLFLDITVNATNVILTPNILMIDPVSGSTEIIEPGAAGIVATGIIPFVFVPRNFAVQVLHNKSGDVTYSVGACFINGG